MSIEGTLAERGARYGDFTDHAIYAQGLQSLMHGSDNWKKMSPDKRQALTVIADKIARILTGDPEYKDNWHDIQGYAKLAEDRCVTDEKPEMGCAERAPDPLDDLRLAMANVIDISRNMRPLTRIPYEVHLALTSAYQLLNQERTEQ
jgi:hypothetical protein